MSPNPFSSVIRLGGSVAIAYERYNSLGMLLLKDNGKEVDAFSLQKGVYLLRITTKHGVIETVRMVKQ